VSLTTDQAQSATKDFLRHYPGALGLAYYFRRNVGELYGTKADGVPVDVKGGFLQVRTEVNGKWRHGRVDVPLDNMEDQDDLMKSLRHEVLGHYGLNTLSPKDKRALMDALIVARNSPGLKGLWDDVDKHYKDDTDDIRAEEVFAAQCERLKPPSDVNTPQMVQSGKAAYYDVCVARKRTVSLQDLESMAYMVADRVQKRSCAPLTIPQINDMPPSNVSPLPRLLRRDQDQLRNVPPPLPIAVEVGPKSRHDMSAAIDLIGLKVRPLTKPPAQNQSGQRHPSPR
jgi:hypothetical protein